MRFNDSLGGGQGLRASVLQGRPAGGASCIPGGEADLRPVLYAPPSLFPDSAAAAAMALFPGDLDPSLAERLASEAFPSPPPSFDHGEGIRILDFAVGRSGNVADHGAALLATLLRARRDGAEGRPPLLLVPLRDAAESAIAAAVAAALAAARGSGEDPARGGADPLLVFLLPAGGGSRAVPRLAMELGLVLEIEGGPEGISRLLDEAAGGELAGRPATIAGTDNPAFLAARMILCAASFHQASEGSSGDLLFSFPSTDGIGLAAALWSWRFGLPLTGAILAVPEEAPIDGLDPAGLVSPPGRELLAAFENEQPGLLGSLVRVERSSRTEAEAARGRLSAAGGPALDLDSAHALAAAERVLAAGLEGHARVVVLREALPPSEEAASSPRGDGSRESGAPPLRAAPTLQALEAAIARARP